MTILRDGATWVLAGKVSSNASTSLSTHEKILIVSFPEYFYQYLPSLNEIGKIPDPEVSPGFFEGDIAGITLAHFVRLGIKWEIFPHRKWKNGIVPYAVSNHYLPDERSVIESAISALNFFTCINFVPWDGRQKDYLLIWPVTKPQGCWSYVGKIGGQQVVSLQRPDKYSLRCLGSIGKPIHELLHALGIFHEQARADRDNHVTINKKNIPKSRLHNFNKQSALNTTYSHPYDYDSVMHYGTHFFSSNRKLPTIVPKKKGVKIGQREMLSKGDCLKVNQLYGCLDRDPFERRKYEAFCNFLAY